VAELADALDSGSSRCKPVWVQVPSSAFTISGAHVAPSTSKAHGASPSRSRMSWRGMFYVRYLSTFYRSFCTIHYIGDHYSWGQRSPLPAKPAETSPSRPLWGLKGFTLFSIIIHIPYSNTLPHTLCFHLPASIFFHYAITNTFAP
jgi:hypothetical protein